MAVGLLRLFVRLFLKNNLRLLEKLPSKNLISETDATESIQHHYS